MSEPPIGRIGYVFEGFGDGRTATGTKESFCLGCRAWFDAREHGCPDCGRELPGFNKEIRTKQLNRHLYQMAEKARA